MQTRTATRHLTSSLLFRLILLLLLVIVPISIAVGQFSYGRVAELIRKQAASVQATWAAGRSDSMSGFITRELRSMRILTRDSSIQTEVTRTVTPAAFADLRERWRQDAVGKDKFRPLYVNNGAGTILSLYTNSNTQAFALLANNQGALLAVNTTYWPQADLQGFGWWPRPLTGAVEIVSHQNIEGIGNNIAVLIVPVASINANSSRGLLAVGINMDRLSQRILRLDPTDGDSSWLVDGEGLVVSRGGASTVTTSQLSAAWMQQIGQPTIEGQSFVSPLDAEGQAVPTLVSYSSLSLSDEDVGELDPLIINALTELRWSVVRATPTAAAYRGLESQLSNSVLGTVVLAAVLIFVVIGIFRLLFLRPLRRLNQAMSRVAVGDFAARVPTDASEIGELGQGFNQMVGDVDSLQRERERRQSQQQQVSRQLQGSAGDLNQSAQQQRAFASEQAASLREIAATFGQLNRSAERIARYGEQVAHVSTDLLREQEAGRMAVEQSQSVLKRLRTESESLVSIAQRQVRNSWAISAVIAEVNRIAEETHLLALNATIEASGAGAAGKRFAAIARQVQQLATAAAVAAENAQASLSEVQGGIQRAVEATGREQAAISEGVQQGRTLESVMLILGQRIEQLNDSTQTIELETRQQKEGSITANNAVEALAAASQQLVSYSQAVGSAANELQHLAERLETRM